MSITFENLSFRYETESILENVSLTMDRGDFTVVVGPNGAGKSTFLRLAAGLLQPYTGQVLVDGMPCPQAQRMGCIHFVPQVYGKNAAQFPATVEEVVTMLLRLEGLSKAERQQRCTEALQLVGMSAYRNRRIGDLSGGEQQRVMIAQALARNAAYLLLDEPTSAIDFRAGEHILQLLDTLRKERNLLVLMVTHDISKSLTYADHVICLNRHVCYAGETAGFVESHLETALSWHIGR